uniref:DE-cadherin-like Ig-like domain-containing protein n=1 Tax=Anopheles epiroticus TaxID=199890 RepID=A0A182P1C6_9DIPT
MGDLQIADGDSNQSLITIYHQNDELSNAEIGQVRSTSNNVHETFEWDESINQTARSFFEINRNTGRITMRNGTPPGVYELRFLASSSGTIFKMLKIKVKKILKKDIERSASIQLHNVTREQFLTKTPGRDTSPEDRLRESIANTLNIGQENVNIFSIQPAEKHLIVRYFVSDSFDSNYLPEFLNAMLKSRVRQLEQDVGLPVRMVEIDECGQLNCDENHYCNPDCGAYTPEVKTHQIVTHPRTAKR